MIYFNICAAAVLCVLLASSVTRKLVTDIPGKIFATMLAVSIVTTFSDILSISMDNFAVADPSSVTPAGTAVRFGAHSCYLLLRNLITPLYITYIISLTDTWHKLKRRPVVRIMLIVPCCLALFLIISNFVNGRLFHFAEDQSYTRGILFPLLYLPSVFYIIFGLIYTIRYRRLFSADKLFAILAIFPMNLAAAVFQWFFPQLQIELFASSIAIMIITMTVQRPEESVDRVTGLRNHYAYGMDRKRCFATDKHISVILINIANYQTLVGITGYDGSNSMLRAAADGLKAIDKEMRTHAEIYYLDKGRFRYVLWGKESASLEDAAERINDFFRQSLVINQMELNLIAYVCTAHCPEDIHDFKSLMDFGNIFHERIPYSGNVIPISKLKTHELFSLTGEMDAIIDDAIAGRKFMVYYQPIYSVTEKRFVSAEALLRLYDERCGFIPPDLFITAAEKSGAIHKIGDYVLDEVCRFINENPLAELGLEYIEINLSVAQCMQSDLADKILSIMNNRGVDPARINLEITETAASYAQNIMTSNIEKLLNAGLTFALDDYGTGYSNIRSVASLPVHIVKLDKTFAIDSGDNMQLALQSTIKMLKDMNRRIVVEGVETEQLVEKFSDLGCDYIQGYYYSKPVPGNEFIDFMLAHKAQ